MKMLDLSSEIAVSMLFHLGVSSDQAGSSNANFPLQVTSWTAAASVRPSARNCGAHHRRCQQACSEGYRWLNISCTFYQRRIISETLPCGLPHYNARDYICSECMADRAGAPFTDLRSSAAWRGTEITTADQFLARASVPPHPLLASRFSLRFSRTLNLCM